jgi:hypothetical protein
VPFLANFGDGNRIATDSYLSCSGDVVSATVGIQGYTGGPNGSWVGLGGYQWIDHRSVPGINGITWGFGSTCPTWGGEVRAYVSFTNFSTGGGGTVVSGSAGHVC